MFSKIVLAYKYCKYLLTAANSKGHGTHSPFVFDFITKVLNDKRNFYSFNTIETIRTQLKANTSEIIIEDFGAGSRIFTSNKRTIQQIANTSLKPAKYSQLLFKIVNHYQPQCILELGTSLGVTTSYLAAANSKAQVITMEGSSEIGQIAQQTFSTAGLNNIELVLGNFDISLPNWLAQNTQKIDFVFLDGNHQYTPTVNYFEQLLSHLHENSIVVLDDIHWSREMEAAWEYVQQHTSVTLSIDLFFIGIVFFRKEQKAKQHFIIRY